MGKNKIKLWFDEETDILYISFRKGPSVDSTQPLTQKLAEAVR